MAVSRLIYVCEGRCDQLAHSIIVPQAVYDELNHPEAPAAVLQWIAEPPGWLQIRIPRISPDRELERADLDPGERDAILLAQELGAGELIIDDQDGRREAQRRKLHYVGTLGVLRLAADKGLLDSRRRWSDCARQIFMSRRKCLISS